MFMKLFRSHTARFSGFLMLMLGMALHYAAPAKEKTNQNAFTTWLGSHLKTQDDTVLGKIDALGNEDSELETLIRKASKLVHTNSDDFELPVSDETESSEEALYFVILTEWNNYNDSSSGMGTAVLVKHLKPQTVLPSDSHFLAYGIHKNSSGFNLDLPFELYSQNSAISKSHILSPLKSGTAIGAP